MRLAEYSDDEIIEELKHRGIKIEVIVEGTSDFAYGMRILGVNIGGVVFGIET